MRVVSADGCIIRRMTADQAATLTLTDFLLARIAEDEEAARGDFDGTPWGETFDVGYGSLGSEDGRGDRYLVIDPARVLAECEAKRRIVEQFPWSTVLTLLALPYADHPDYREEWKP